MTSKPSWPSCDVAGDRENTNVKESDTLSEHIDSSFAFWLFMCKFKYHLGPALRWTWVVSYQGVRTSYVSVHRLSDTRMQDTVLVVSGWMTSTPVDMSNAKESDKNKAHPSLRRQEEFQVPSQQKPAKTRDEGQCTFTPYRLMRSR